MKYIVQLPDQTKTIMDVISSIPVLPDGWQILGTAESMPDAIIEIETNIISELAKSEARQFLIETDWQVTRHRDQLDAGIPTSLTTEEFATLLTQRQAARDSI